MIRRPSRCVAQLKAPCRVESETRSDFRSRHGHRVTGLEGWFAVNRAPGALISPPPPWMQTLSVLLAPLSEGNGPELSHRSADRELVASGSHDNLERALGRTTYLAS